MPPERPSPPAASFRYSMSHASTATPDVLGQALLDYQHGHSKAALTVHCSAADDEPLPAAYFFRTLLAMPELERQALDECRGRVLDLGAGAGCHTLELQSRDFTDIKSLDHSLGAVQVMQARGVRQPTHGDIYTARAAQELPYDTILLLMNGLGLAGTLEGIDKLLAHARTLLAPDGQILATSTDIKYLFEDEEGALNIDLNANYYGEVEYQFEYKNQVGAAFPWLFIDAQLLEDAARQAGYEVDFLGHDDGGQYLVRLTLVGGFEESV
jgi:SAM-dependent methyltransferase